MRNRMANPQDPDLPIALRRTPRHCAGVAAQSAQSRVGPAVPASVLKTPSKPRPQKRVRFSDPGPELSRYDAGNSTGLTPMVKRSWLGEPSPKRRRSSAAAASIGATWDQEPTTTRGKKNAKTRTRKQNNATKAKAEAELQRLRADLADRDAEIERLHNETLAHDTERILELERQIEGLRAELAQQQLPRVSIEGEDDEEDDASDDDGEAELPSHSFYDWTLATREPFSDSYLDGDDDARDITMTDVVCSTPSRRRKSADRAPIVKSASASFPTPPCTSPTLPATPCSIRESVPPLTPPSHAGIQASLPDPEKESLEAELTSLRLELTKLTATLENHATLQTRLSEKLSGAASPPPAAESSERSQPQLEEHLNSVLQKLSDRTEALCEIDASLGSLGFAGEDAGEVIASIASGFRTARLELEYLTPGEITLPLSSHCAEVLELLLTRLRELGRRAHEDEETIDEYHALELSLRQQLQARVDAMARVRDERERNATALRERDDRIADLEVGLDRLKGAAEGYRRDITELEALVQRLEDGAKTTEAELRADLAGARAQLDGRSAATADLEARLADTLRQADDLERQLRDLQRRKDAEAKVRNKSYGAALALRDARVLELRREIYGINESLRAAHDTIAKLHVENTGLERRVEEAEEGTRLARAALEAVKAELEKVTAAAAAAAPSRPRRTTRSNSNLATPEPQPGTFLSGDLARSGARKSTKKRRYDSGLGMLDEDDI